jgi:nitrite reductase (NO-forming)
MCVLLRRIVSNQLIPNTSRRRVLQALGAGGAVALAGCSSESEPVEETSQEQTQQTQVKKGLDAAKQTDVDRVAADPTEIPDPVDWTEPKHHEISLTVEEVTAEIEPGVTFDYMAFEGQIPGPMLRVRKGDTVRLTLKNSEGSSSAHNIDLHAVFGPGGGAEDTTVKPGESTSIEFKAMYPGVHIYHCAVPNMDMHISSGMFGAILVEPKSGLPEADRELYFGQHELYTKGETGEEGHHIFDQEAMKNENPTYVPISGEPWAFTGDGYGPVTVEKDESVRVFYVNGGPNLMSSWHPIGNIWETFYRGGSLASDPEHYVQTAAVPPGCAAAAKMDTPVPGPIKIVDHALSRAARRGTLGVVEVEGNQEPEIYKSDP